MTGRGAEKPNGTHNCGGSNLHRHRETDRSWDRIIVGLSAFRRVPSESAFGECLSKSKEASTSVRQTGVEGVASGLFSVSTEIVGGHETLPGLLKVAVP
jgi:hypothetical protein